MVRTPGSLLNEPRVPDPPARVWRDWVLVAALLVGSLLEVLLRDDVAWPPVALAASALMVYPLLIRRTAPLRAVAVAFLSVPTVGAITVAVTGESLGLNSLAVLLVLPYALVRWGSGREIRLGLLIVLYAWVVGTIADSETIADVLGGLVVLVIVVELATIVRFQDRARRQALTQARLQEREQIARELHDTIAHHVSAIAVQAQAGRTVAVAKPEAAAQTLAVIEEAASRTLADMRAIVGGLRGDDDSPDRSPQRGIADIPRLAGTPADGPRVTVALRGDLSALRPSVDAAVYRMAQESITNARRHARAATTVDVVVSGEPDCVTLQVSDDGDTRGRPANPSAGAGYGLIGMNERATMLGGTLQVGPDAGGGWRIVAVIPRDGAPR